MHDSFGTGRKIGHDDTAGEPERLFATRPLTFEDDPMVGDAWSAVLLGCGVIVPPIVQASDGQILLGQEVLLAIVDSGRDVPHPVIQGATPAVAAHVERHLQAVAFENGWRVGYPDDGMDAVLAALDFESAR